jgi:hypothetical protein
LVAIERESGSVEGDLLIGRGNHHFLNRFEALHLLFELDQLLLEPRGPGHKLLRGRLTGGCLAIGGIELAQIARATLSSICARRRSIFPFVKLLSREFTALNLLPSIATLAFASSPILRH